MILGSACTPKQMSLRRLPRWLRKDNTPREAIVLWAGNFRLIYSKPDLKANNRSGCNECGSTRHKKLLDITTGFKREHLTDETRAEGEELLTEIYGLCAEPGAWGAVGVFVAVAEKPKA